MRVLSAAAYDTVKDMPRGDHVFPAQNGDTPMRGFARVWRRVAHRMAGLPTDVTPHVLRHSFASVAADLGYADATIAGPLGHKGHTITRRYIHSADSALLAAADAVANKITAMMMVNDGRQSEVLVSGDRPNILSNPPPAI